MKKSLLSHLGRGTAGILGLLTVSACYGTPYDEYEPKPKVRVGGCVTNEDNKPIPGISVYGAGAGATTSEDGSYLLYGTNQNFNSVKLRFVDTDGEANGGKFKDKTVTVKLSYDEQFSYNDVFEADNVNVKLEKESE